MICLSTFSKDFSSETTRPISIKFHMQSLDRRGKESLYISSRSHDQDARHAIFMVKTLKNVLLHNH